MQSKRRFALFCLLAIGTLTMGCSLGSLPTLFATPTPTITPTLTPTATRTPSPTNTPIPILDLSGTVITAADLPAGFEPIDSENPGISSEGEVSFAFMNINNLETVMGFCTYLLNDTDRTGFRATIINPITIMDYIFSDSGYSLSQSDEIPTDGIGHLSGGATASGTLDGMDIEIYAILFQRGDVGCTAFVIRFMDQGGTVSVVDIARIWDERLAEFYP